MPYNFQKKNNYRDEHISVCAILRTIKHTAKIPSNDEPKMSADFTTQCVIIGSGPAGGALASFLAQNGKSRTDKGSNICLPHCQGIKGIIVSKTSSTARTPRAHTTNIATMGQY